MVGEAVEQSGGQLLVAEDPDPFGEGEVGGDDGRAALVAVGEDVEEQLAAGAVEGHEAELVADQQVHSLKPLLQASQLPLIAGFDQIADEIGGLAEPDPVPALCGLDAESDREMRLSGADGSDQDDVVAAVDVVAGGQLAQLRVGDALQGLEVDLFERLVVGEAGRAQPALDGAGVTIPDLGLEQLPEVVLVVPLRVLGLTRHLLVVAQHGRHLERLEALLDDGSARGPAHDAAS